MTKTKATAAPAPDDEPSLRTLLERALPELTALVHRHFPRSLRPLESATDIVQSICGDLLATDVAFEYRGKAQFSGWLKVCVLHKLARHVRRLPGAPAIAALSESQFGGDDAPSPAQEVVAREHLGLLDRTIAALPEQHREMIVRRHLQQQSRARIAADLGLSLAAVTNRIARAKARLAAAMDRDARAEP